MLQANLETITAELKTTVRFEQSQNPAIPSLDAALVGPASARLIKHPLLTNENLDAIAPDAKNWQYAAYVGTTTYSIGDRVEFNGVNYQSRINSNSGNPPDTSPNAWGPIDFLSDWLEGIRTEATRSVIMDSFNKKKNERYTKEQLDHLILFQGIGRQQDKEVKRGRLVGLEFQLLQSNNIALVLNRLMTQFDTANPALTFRLYHSSQPTELLSFTIDHNIPSGAIWHFGNDLNGGDQIELLYTNFEEDIDGGTYYLMYDESELIGQAVRKRFTLGTKPCSSCSRYNSRAYQRYSQFVRMRSVSVAETKKPAAGEMFDINDVTHQKDTNYGLNLEISSYCNLTEYLIQQQTLFSDAIAEQVKADLLQYLINTTRNNVISEQVKQNARFALQNQDLGGEGLLEKLSSKKDAIGFEISNLQNSVCMPTLPSKSIRFRSIGSNNPSSILNRY